MSNDTSTDPLKHLSKLATKILEVAAGLKNEFLVVAVVLVVTSIVGEIFAPRWLDKGGRGLLYTGLGLAFVAYMVTRILMIRAEMRQQEFDHAENLAQLAAAKEAKTSVPVPIPQTSTPPTPAPQPPTQNSQSPIPQPALPPEALRDRYLRELMGQCAYLKMTTVDLKVATRQEAAELDLAAVFTDLDVYDSDARRQKDSESLREDVEPGRRRPALEALSRYPRLVLRGEAGSGKSTLVNFVTVCLAGDWLNSLDANLRRLGDAWRLPRLLPVRVVLRDYAARGLPADQGLWAFIQAELARVETCDGTLDACLPVLEAYLKQRDGALLLLDGLDEVPEVHKYRLRLKAAVEQFTRDFPHCRILVTTRPYAYQDSEAYLSGFEARVLASFSDEQIKAFIPRWYAHVGAKDPTLGPDNAARYAEQLVNAVERNPRLAALAPNPLLLTLMTSLHRWREGGSLPERRQELYEQSVILLLDLWQRPKQLFDAQGHPTGKEYDVFTELGIAREELRRALNRVAYEAHWKQPTLIGTHDIRARDLAGVLFEAADKAKAQGQGRIIDYLINRAGLLIERDQGGVYTFPHRTFQEYLAACHLTEEDYPFTLADRLREDDARWREAALLAAAKAVEGANATIWLLVSAFCPDKWPPPGKPVEADWYAALRAAQALVETEQYQRVPDRQQPLLKRLRDWLAHVLEDSPLPAPERAAAGRTLAVLGDSRLGVGVVQVERTSESASHLPDLQWCYVPPGPFVMGASKRGATLRHPVTGADFVVPPDPEAYDDEGPPYIQDVPDGYWMLRYPITNAQFQTFVDDGGYGNFDWWTKAGWGWRGDRKAPDKQGGVYDLPNHPAVMITWYEAYAFCRWLGHRLQVEGFTFQVEKNGNFETLDFGLDMCRLPTEAEWEKVARGGLDVPAQPLFKLSNELLVQHSPSTIQNRVRRYPWGASEALDVLTPEYANYDQTGINTTSAVGAFPGGASPYGVLDMSGNVWEWCLTRWVDNYEKYDKKESNNPEGDAARVVRGGAFDDDVRLARCAARDGYGPGDRLTDLGFRVVVGVGAAAPIDSGL